MAEKYMGYILKSWSYTYEEKEWCGGHSSEGTGRYLTNYGYEIIDPKTGKSFIVHGSEKDAKNEIDKLTNSYLRKESRKAKSSILRFRNELKALEESVENKKRELDRKVWEKRRKLKELEDSLAHKIAKNFT